MQVFFSFNSRLTVEGSGLGFMRSSDGVVRIGDAQSRQLGGELGANAARGAGV